MKKFLTVFLLSAGCTAAYEPITDDSYYPGKYAPSESTTLRPEPKPACRWVLGRNNQRLYLMGDNCVTLDRSEAEDRQGTSAKPTEGTPEGPSKPGDTPSKPTHPGDNSEKPEKPTSAKPTKPEKPNRLGNPGNHKPVGRAGEQPNKKDGWGGGSRGRSDG